MTSIDFNPWTGANDIGSEIYFTVDVYEDFDVDFPAEYYVKSCSVGSDDFSFEIIKELLKNKLIHYVERIRHGLLKKSLVGVRKRFFKFKYFSEF